LIEKKLGSGAIRIPPGNVILGVIPSGARLHRRKAQAKRGI
jgi:hypothetical protein